MKRLVQILLPLIILGCLFVPTNLAKAQDTQNFQIHLFKADYYLTKDGNGASNLRTTETIDAEFPYFDQNHGILRAIPETYLDHTLSLHIDNIKDGLGDSQPYSTSHQNGNLVLKIGDKNTYVHGPKQYVITYDEKDVTGLYQDHDELYWNVNGEQWPQPMDEVVAQVHIPANLVDSVIGNPTCYEGSYGSTTNCKVTNSTNKDGSELFTFYSPNGISSYQTQTFVIGFKADTFKLGPEIAQAQQRHNEIIALVVAAIFLPPFLCLCFLYYKWRKYGRDPKGRGVIIPEYQPPKGLNVLTSDYILLEKLDKKAISALVIELAIRGYLNICELKQKKRLQKDQKTYSLKVVKDPSSLSEDEQRVLNLFFNDSPTVGNEINLKDINTQLYKGLKPLSKDLGATLYSKGFFRNDPNAVSLHYYSIATVIGVIGFVLLFTGILAVAAIPFILCAFVFVMFSRYMPSRSEQGTEVHDHMLGLRDYIKLAEADRIKYLQSPEGAEKVEEAGLDPSDPKFKVKLFESLLPYAMIFGIEKDWAKQFTDVYKNPPSWFNGDWTTFNTFYLASSLGGFNTANNLAFSPPHSSGSSGFGGGGFSGGGGGGGGGGGW